jgi:hypothetical protein
MPISMPILMWRWSEYFLEENRKSIITWRLFGTKRGGDEVKGVAFSNRLEINWWSLVKGNNILLNTQFHLHLFSLFQPLKEKM